MAGHSQGSGNGNVSKVKTTMQTYSDFNLAYKLQEEEFGTFYDHNRSERRLVGGDTRTAKQKQLDEMMRIREDRRREAQRIAEEDEQLARRLQERYNQESSGPQNTQPPAEVIAPPQINPPVYSGPVQPTSTHPSGCFPVNPPIDLPIPDLQRPLTVDQQIEEDARIAQEIAARYEPPPGNIDEDERMARRLQEKYERRSRRSQQLPEQETPQRATHIDRTGLDRCSQCQGPMPVVALATNSPENARRCNDCRSRHEEPPPYSLALLYSTPTGAPATALGWNTPVQRRDSQHELPVQDQVAISHLIGSQPKVEMPRPAADFDLPPPSRLALGDSDSLDSPLPPPPPPLGQSTTAIQNPQNSQNPHTQFHPTNPFLRDLIQLNQN